MTRETDAESQPLIANLKRALYADHPLDFLAQVSGLMAATEPRVTIHADEKPKITLPELVETFLGTELNPVTAALTVIAAFTDDEVLATRIRRELDHRFGANLPRWIARLDEVEVTGVWETSEEMRDGENYAVELRFADRSVLTVVAYVDNNLGEVVKDGFAYPLPATEMRRVAEQFEDAPVDHREVDPAWARARVEQALENGAITYPPYETETWPAARPLLRWALGLLPAGGELEPWDEWSDERKAELVGEFLRSPYGEDIDDGDHRALLGDLLWFGNGYGNGDPLRWSAVNVEILLTDWFPRKIVADVALLAKLPRLLRAWVRFCHEQRGISREGTRSTLASVDRWEPEYQHLIRTDRPQGAEALARMLLEERGMGADLGADAGPTDLVGGPETLATLTTEPLPDEPFDWSGIPDDIGAKVGAMLTMLDENAEEFLDVEHRTAYRRLLRAVVLADPAYFRGRAAARTSAAAIAWLVAHANNSIGPYADATAGELLAPFGVTSAGDRAHRFLKALGLPPHEPWMGPVSLGSPDYLVSVRRAEIIAERDFGA